MPVDVTVAVPTYNGAKRLPLLFDRLRSQLHTDPISWEILIIDNNSTDDTAAIIKAEQEQWSNPFPLRYCFEEKQGAAFARQRAAQEAKGDLIAFLDDDILPDPDWLRAVFEFGNTHPQAGAYSGQIHGLYEVEPPPNFKQIQAYLSIREHGSVPKLFEPERLHLPTAAALVIRKQAWFDSIPPIPVLVGRIGNSMVGGEDYELSLHLHKQGWEIWYNPAMQVYHQIPKHRLETPYLSSLGLGCGLATCQLLMINASPQQKPIIFIKTVLGSSRRLATHIIKHWQNFKTDPVIAAQTAFHWGSLLSPFYFLKLQFQSAVRTTSEAPSNANHLGHHAGL